MDVQASSSWIKRGPLYQVVTKDWVDPRGRLSNFAFIARHLEAREAASVQTIWLSGVAKNEAFGTTPYSIIDPFAVEEAYGTVSELRMLIDSAHDHGIYVINDYIGNHLSQKSPYVDLHPGWFLRDERGSLVTGTDLRGAWSFDDTYQLDFLNPEVRDYLFRLGRHWLDFGFDGLRIDAPFALFKDRMEYNWYNGRRGDLDLLYPSEFLAEFTASMRQAHPGAAFLAEALDQHQRFWDCGIDLALDGNFIFTLCDVLLGQNGKTPGDFGEYLRDSLSCPLLHQTVHFKDGHDIRDPEHSSDGLGKPRNLDAGESLLAAALMVAMPGVPAFFNGEFEAVLGYPYLRGRVVPINWDLVDIKMAYRYLELMDLSKLPLFRQGRSMFVGSSNPNISAFARQWEDQTAVIAANLASGPDHMSDRTWGYLDVRGLGIPGNGQLTLVDMATNSILAKPRASEVHANGLLVALYPRQAQIIGVLSGH